jgi:hypothetical protein
MTYKGNRRLLGAFLLIVLAGTITSSVGMNAGIMRTANASIASETNVLEQSNFEDIDQFDEAVNECLSLGAFCINLAINNAIVDQDNDEEQANVNVQDPQDGNTQ